MRQWWANLLRSCQHPRMANGRLVKVRSASSISSASLVPESTSCRPRSQTAFALLFAMLPLCANAAEPAQPTRPKELSATTATPVTDLIDIRPQTFLSSVSAGDDFGIAVDITNKSHEPVFLHPRYFVITLPPQLERQAYSPTGWSASFTGRPGNRTPDGKTEDFFESPVRIEAGSSTSAFWTRRSRPEKDAEAASDWGALTFLLQQLTFTPGDYVIKLNATTWTKKDNVGHWDTDDSKSQVVDIKVPVAAPQWVIIVGAVVGGLIAYVLLPKTRLELGRAGIGGILTSALLSVIVTILLSRLSETQFVIRVTVNDIWGAIALGFVGSASGTSILKKLADGSADDAKGSGKKQAGDSKKAATTSSDAGADPKPSPNPATIPTQMPRQATS
jgi:hypothetical protein